jgi:hypothetical protein
MFSHGMYATFTDYCFASRRLKPLKPSVQSVICRQAVSTLVVETDPDNPNTEANLKLNFK